MKRGKGYMLCELSVIGTPKLSLSEIISMWADRILLRGYSFTFSIKEPYERFIEQAKGWLKAKRYDAMMIVFNPANSAILPYPYHVMVLIVSPDTYVPGYYSKLEGLGKLALELAGTFVEITSADTGVIRFWYGPAATSWIEEVIPFGQLCGLSGDQWKDYITSKSHNPYFSGVSRWFPE